MISHFLFIAFYSSRIWVIFTTTINMKVIDMGMMTAIEFLERLLILSLTVGLGPSCDVVSSLIISAMMSIIVAAMAKDTAACIVASITTVVVVVIVITIYFSSPGTLYHLRSSITITGIEGYN